MHIPINVNVFCNGELCGHSICLVINPVNERITHLVVAEKAFPNIQRMVPVSLIIEPDLPYASNAIQLRCSRKEFSDMDMFKVTDFIESGKLESSLPHEAPYALWPYSMHEPMALLLEHESIPAGEVAIHRGTPVIATDGRVGKVDEFLVDPKNDVITYIVMREGHLWGQMDVTIPVSALKKIEADAVYLKMDKKAVEELPAISVKRKWK